MDQKEIHRYKHIHYICSTCGDKRYIMLNKFIHLNRKDLINQGLAMYIDLHMDIKDTQRKEHGVKIHIDSNFQVRSNTLLNLKDKVLTNLSKKRIPGIPAPSLKITETSFNQDTISWNYFQLDSYPHNVSLRITNDRDNKESKNIHLISPLESVETKMRYNSDLLSDEYLTRTNKWIDMVIKWIELSSELDDKVIVPLLRFVDRHHSVEPSLHDELAISLIVDESSMIKLCDELYQSKIDEIFKNRDNDYSGLYPMMGLNEEALKYITHVLSSNKFIIIKEFIHNLHKAGGDNSEQFVDTFIQIFFDLMAKDSFEYHVSYFS